MKKLTATTALLLTLCTTSSFANMGLTAEEAVKASGDDVMGTVIYTSYQNNVVYMHIKTENNDLAYAHVQINGNDLPAGLALLSATGKKVAFIGPKTNFNSVSVVTDEYWYGKK